MASTWPEWRRLSRRGDFRSVYEQGMRRASLHFTVFGRPRAGEPGAPTRYGITVTRKVGNAVVRNHIRRRTREILRRHAGVPGTGWDVVVNPRGAAHQAPFAMLEAELSDHLRRLGEALRARFPAAPPRSG